MQKQYVLIALIITTIISLKYSGGPANIVNDAYTGAPGESGTVCGNCHNSGTFGVPVADLVITDVMGGAVTKYIPGEMYQITLTATAAMDTPSGYGFQLTVLDGGDNDVANFSNPSSNAQISSASNVASGRTYAEHISASASNTFTFDWEAPNGGTGDLTFYYNVNLVNGNGGTSGDNGGPGYSTSMSESNPIVKIVGALDINNAYVLPKVDGTANQVLTTDGNGSVSWMNAPTSFTDDTPTDNDQKRFGVKAIINNDSRREIDNLKAEVTLLKSEIEALKKLIEKLTKE